MTQNNITLIVDVTVAQLLSTTVTDYRLNSENCSKHVGCVHKNLNGEWCAGFINRKKGWVETITEDNETAFSMVEANINRFFKEFGIKVEFSRN